MLQSFQKDKEAVHYFTSTPAIQHSPGSVGLNGLFFFNSEFSFILSDARSKSIFTMQSFLIKDSGKIWDSK